MSNQQPKRPAQVARVVPPQERQVTAAEIRNALQSLVRRLERVEDKVDRLTSLAETSLSESDMPRTAPVAPPSHAEATADLPDADEAMPAADAKDEMEPQPELRVVPEDAADRDPADDDVDDTGSMEPVPDAPSLMTGPAVGDLARSSISPPPPPPFGSASSPEERSSEERHSRIAERFAERAPEPLDDSPDEMAAGPDVGTQPDAEPTAPATPFATQEPVSSSAPVRRRGRHGRSAGRVAFWAVLAVAVVAGSAYMVLDDPQEPAEDQTADANLLDQEPDETIPVPGQSPLQDDDAADAASGDVESGIDDTAPATADAVGGEPAGDPSVEFGPVPGEAAEDDPETTAAVDSEPSGDGAVEDDPADAGTAMDDGGAVEETGTEPTVADTAAGPLEGAEPATPELSSDPGPEVAVLPVPDVETVELSDLAPLPDDAPDELRQVSALALEGNPEAQHDLATAYAIGTMIPQNFERAAFWYARSADAGIVNARYNLGVLTERGLGVEQDSEVAFEMFLEAANAGHPDAENAVGLAYMHGHGTERDLLQAATWFQSASGQGNPRGAYHLGRLFEEGLDGAPDLTAAAGWYRVAAEAGDPQAEEALARISPAIAEGDIPEAVDVPIPETTPEPVTPGTAQDLAVTAAEVREIQERLVEQGYNAGTPDGVMGPTTRRAIEAFQQDNNLSLTGEPSFSLLDALRAAPTDGGTE